MEHPTKIEVNGKIYDIDTSYKTALACYKAINDSEINDMERGLAVVTMLLGNDVPLEDTQEALQKCGIYLRCGKKQNVETKNIDMDYFQDESAIRTSIRQCYHENPNEKNYHWWEYNELIEGLTEETLLSRIREIRNYDLSKEKDPQIREKIRKAQERVALEKQEVVYTDEQKKNMEDFLRDMEEV